MTNTAVDTGYDGGIDIALPTTKLIARKCGHIGWIVLNQPEKYNAISEEMWAALPVALDALEEDATIRVIVLTGAGEKAFTSGADISEFEKIRTNAALQAAWAQTAETARRRVLASTKPLIAMIRGFCLGGGVQIAINADVRISAADAQFGIPAARLGSAYQPQSVERLVALIGPAATSDILLSGRRFDAAEACQLGLVNRIVASEMLLQATTNYAESIAANAPLSTRSMKFIIQEVQKPVAERDQRLMDALVHECHASADNAEGRTAFMEKRMPVFNGH